MKGETMKELLNNEINETKRELDKIRDRANKLAVLGDFMDHWSDFIANRMNSRLEARYGKEFQVEEVELDYTNRNRKPNEFGRDYKKKIQERLVIHFNFTEYPYDSRFDFNREIVEPVIEEINPHPYLDVFVNTNSVDKNGTMVINLRVKNHTSYQY